MRSDPCAVSPAYNIRPELIEYTARVYTRYTEPAFCELTNTGPRLVYRGKLKIHRKSRVGRPTLFPRNLVLSCDSWHPQFLPRIRLGGTKKRKEKKISWKLILSEYVILINVSRTRFLSETPPSRILYS